ncbi:MAG: alpha/beta fold hydrolase [Proteobacteria bacterium]|nr:alpha/beta fold hydrolase [Pseudomonadota bacterium]
MRTPTPWGMYRIARDQLGSIRTVYLGSDRVERRGDFHAEGEIVLLLHGFFQTRNIWEVMEDRLRHDGYAVMSFNLGGLLYRFNTHPVDHLAKLIADKVDGLARRHGFERIHIIGHSKGGLVARRYIQAYGGDQRVKSLTTLGTPHHGTWTAALGAIGLGAVGWGTSVRELLPRSKTIKRLTSERFPDHIPLTSIYSRADLVCPWWHAALHPSPEQKGMHTIEVPGVGHSELTWNPAVYRQVKIALDDASAHWNARAKLAKAV